MTALQAAIVIGGSFVLVTMMIAVMNRMNRSEQLIMERRRAEWMARGGDPDDEPMFYSGAGS